MALIVKRPTPPKVTVVQDVPKHIDLFYNRGESAYEVAVANGFVGTEQAWLASIDGNVAIQEHVQSTTPHPAYDDLPSLNLLFENGLI